MKDQNGKNQPKNNSQLELFNAQQASQPTPEKGQQPPKVISMADYKQQQDIKRFYEVASQVTSHLDK
jgi:hypothetical protein